MWLLRFKWLPDMPDQSKGDEERISNLEKDIDIRDSIDQRRRTLQGKVLSPIVNFFIFLNCFIIALVGGLAIADITFTAKAIPHQNIINDKVIIAVISATAVQTAAIIIAAFRGLFRES